MDIKEQHISVSRTARYYRLGELSHETRHVWFVLHGHGQLARRFIRRFDGIASAQTVVVAPEALSRFYADTTYNQIGATWMTREDRDHEISDYVNYLNALYDQLLDITNRDTLTIHVLGFSQGAATACRWVTAGHIHCDKLVLWAGFFPKGLREIVDPQRLTTVMVTYVYGRQDEYIEKLSDPDEYINRIRQDVPPLTVVPFDGGHVVERAVLQQLL